MGFGVFVNFFINGLYMPRDFEVKNRRRSESVFVGLCSVVLHSTINSRTQRYQSGVAILSRLIGISNAYIEDPACSAS